MRIVAQLMMCLFVAAETAVQAETPVFMIANEGGGYAVDQCLARGETCGAHAALSYCRSRNFAEAFSYRRVDPDEIIGSVPNTAGNCRRSRCKGYIAITCQR